MLSPLRCDKDTKIFHFNNYRGILIMQISAILCKKINIESEKRL